MLSVWNNAKKFRNMDIWNYSLAICFGTANNSVYYLDAQQRDILVWPSSDTSCCNFVICIQVEFNTAAVCGVVMIWHDGKWRFCDSVILILLPNNFIYIFLWDVWWNRQTSEAFPLPWNKANTSFSILTIRIMAYGYVLEQATKPFTSNQIPSFYDLGENGLMYILIVYLKFTFRPRAWSILCLCYFAIFNLPTWNLRRLKIIGLFRH